jgi:hypothetical protein
VHTLLNYRTLQVWDDYGDDLPLLQNIARRTLAAWAQATESEGAWKELAAVHTKLRNKLSKKRAEKLQYVRGNKRALQRAAFLPEQSYNWVGATGDVEAEDDSDGESIDEDVLAHVPDDEDDIQLYDIETVPLTALDSRANAWEEDDTVSKILGVDEHDDWDDVL